MNSSEPCRVCRTTMELADTQPVGEQFAVQFYRCPLCGKSSQSLMHSELTAIDVSSL